MGQDPGADGVFPEPGAKSVPARSVPSPQIAQTDTWRLCNRRCRPSRLQRNLTGCLSFVAPGSARPGKKAKTDYRYWTVISVCEMR